jgi:hypothetical protein
MDDLIKKYLYDILDDYIKFLVYSQSSCDQTIAQLTMISDIHFPDNPLTELIGNYETLGKRVWVKRLWV